MKSLSIILTTLSFVMLLTLPSVSESQSVDKAASQVTDTFLKSIKIINLPEGRKILNSVAWRDAYHLPELIKSEKMYEGMFDTEIKNVKGYKRVVSAHVLSKAKTTLVNKYMIIAYKNTKTGKWKVYSFTEPIDVDKEIPYFKSQLGNTEYVKDQFNYRTLGFWYTVAGRFDEATEAFVQAKKLNKANPDDKIPQSAFDEELNNIRLITGK